MTNNSSSNIADASPRRRIFAWLLFPLALFPLAALLTYDWRAIPALNSPPAASSNWIGALGDGFAYYGYLIFGLAIWIAPLMCIAAALCLVHGRRTRLASRTFWSVVLLCATACLLQVVGNHANGVSDAARRINLSDAGGAVGYLTMTRLLSPLLSDFGSAVRAVIVLAVALVAAAGTRELA